MVKFSVLALATALAAAVSADAAAPVKKSIKLGDRKLRRGDKVTEALLKKAVPYKKSGAKNTARKLDQNEFEITGDYAIKFAECVDLKIYDEDLFENENDNGQSMVNYVKEGQITPVKNVVLFHVCQMNSDCGLESDDNLWVVDLGTYVGAMSKHFANERTDFCEQCNEFDDYCNPEEEEQEQQEEEDNQEEEENNEQEEEEGEENEEEGEDEEDRRKLKKTDRKLANYINCNQCAAQGCFVDEENQDDRYQSQEELDESISEWIAEVAECKETGALWNNMEVSVGFMCTEYGDGVELAAFLDDECSWYTTQKSFSDVYNYANDEDNQYNINYVTYAENYVKNAFSQTISCEVTQYDDPDEENNGDNNNNQEEKEASEYCQELLNDDAANFNYCQADQDNNNDNNNDNNAAYYDWYTADIQGEADDIAEICATIKKMENTEGSSGRGSHVYNPDSEGGSGSWYKRNKKGQIITGDEAEGMSGGAIFMIVLLVLGAVGAVGYLAMNAMKKKSAEADYQGGEMS